MKSFQTFLPIFLVIIICWSCSEEEAKTPTEPSLKSAYQDDFYIGAALGESHILGTDSTASALIEREFNTITPENIMKSMYIHPAEDTFFFETADKMVELGEVNDMFIVGHALVWHSQMPDWLNQEMDSTIMSNHLKKHIQTIVERYKGRIDGWDVVNEALNEDGTLRESIFLKNIGADYLRQAFEAAAAADPDGEYYYNDYNLWKPSKREGVVKLVKDLQASGTRIDGVGLQAHWSLEGPSIEDIEASILAYAELGVKVMFTELDVTVLPNPWDLEGAEVSQNYEGSPFMNPYPESLPDSVQMQLAQRYEDIFNLFLKHQDKISRVTFWGVNDEHSWLNGWPIKNRTNYPLLFDRNYKPKAAYEAVMNLKTRN